MLVETIEMRPLSETLFAKARNLIGMIDVSADELLTYGPRRTDYPMCRANFAKLVKRWHRDTFDPDERDTTRLRRFTRRLNSSKWQFVDQWNEILPDHEITVCEDCEEIFFTDLGIGVSDDRDPICQSCVRANYYECNRCENYTHNDTGVYINGYGRICDSCYESGRVECSTCSVCDEIFTNDSMVFDDDGDAYCSDHAPEPADCECQHTAFDFPALCAPQKTVQNDEIIPVTVGHGEVSYEGVRQIVRTIYDKTRGKWGYSGVQVDEIVSEEIFDHAWQTKEGNFTKRLAKHLLMEHTLKLSDELMGEIGNIARANAASPGTHYISVTRNLNQPPFAFHNDGSCWWGSESQSRCELKAWYGFGVRTWRTMDEVTDPDDEENFNGPLSRAWLVPLSVSVSGVEGTVPKFSATHVLPADAYVLFNAYGSIEQLPYARIVASMVGKSYRKLGSFTLAGAYINTPGVLVAEQSICDQTYEVHLTDRRRCDGNCGSRRRR